MCHRGPTDTLHSSGMKQLASRAGSQRVMHIARTDTTDTTYDGEGRGQQWQQVSVRYTTARPMQRMTE